MRKRPRCEAKVTETGGGAFHFELTIVHDVPRGRTTVAINGDVTVGADNRVAKVAYVTAVNGHKTFNLTTSMEFSDYGAPVRVEKP